MAAVAPLLGSAPVAAQWFGDEPEPMPPQAIARIVARHGFTGFSPPRLSGDVYIVNAVADDGVRVRVVIDAFSGRILRPLGVSQDVAPRRVGRLRPWDYTPDEDLEEERRPLERFGGPGPGRNELLPPRPVGRPPVLEERASRERDIEVEREYIEPYRPPADRPQRSEPPVRLERSPDRSTARLGEPPRDSAGPSGPGRPRAPARTGSPASPAPAAPPPVVETPAPQPEAKPATTAAVPPPVVPKTEPPPASPAAPPAVTQAPETGAADKQAKPQPPAPSAPPAPAAPAATASTSPPPKVRVIEGVTPVLPQSTPPADKGSSSEPGTIPK